MQAERYLRKGGVARGAACLFAIVFCHGQWASSETVLGPGDLSEILEVYCYDCHGEGDDKGGVKLDGYGSPEALFADHGLWDNILKRLRSDTMPPQGKFRPTPEETAAIAAWVKAEVFDIDPRNPDPGHVVVRRVNRTEYRNTIRDLTGIEFNTFEEFPPDDTSYGFDNVGSTLTVSPLHMEKYIRAAQDIAEQAVPAETTIPREMYISGSELRGKKGRGKNGRFSFGETGQGHHSFNTAFDGRYRVILSVDVDSDFEFAEGEGALTFSVDGDEKFEGTFDWGHGRNGGHNESEGAFSYEANWQAGKHTLAFSFEPTPGTEVTDETLELEIESIQIVGPLEREHGIHPHNYERFFTRDRPPESPADRLAYAQEILSDFAGRAYRRPATGETLEALTTIARKVYTQPGRTFEEGIQQAVAAVLASPQFLFRASVADPSAPQDGHPYVDEYTLASRLSYFLWSTMPDEELMALASGGRLRDNLSDQIDRMMADARSSELADNFVGQWLQTRDITSVGVNEKAVLGRKRLDARGRYVDFSSSLRKAMAKESTEHFNYIMREDRSALEFIDSKYGFMNEELGDFYGIKRWRLKGEKMRRVKLPRRSPRGGVITQAAVLTVTSNPTRTSPVKRGLFVLDNIMGTPTPAAPAGVPELEEAAEMFEGHEPSLRELLEEHRKNPSCSVCHDRFDPLGLALENFNALGLWRDEDSGQAIEPAGELITGEAFGDIDELKDILKNERRRDFYRCITEKMMIYALGRGLEYYDVHTVDEIVEEMDRTGGRFSVLMMGIINSAPFQKQRSPGHARETVARAGVDP
jgi:hypothetical protein